MRVDLTKLSITELEALVYEVGDELAARRQQESKRLFEDFKKQAEQAGLTMNEVLSTSSKKQRRPRAQPAYRNPKNAKQTWSGKGRQPKWLSDLIEHGCDPETLRIKPA